MLATRGYFDGEEVPACDGVGATPLCVPLTSGSKAKGRFGKQDLANWPTTTSIAARNATWTRRNRPCKRVQLETSGRNLAAAEATEKAEVQPDQRFIDVDEFSWSLRIISYHAAGAPRGAGTPLVARRVG